jgi:hypothetical protein
MARKQKQQAENPSEISKRVAAQEQKGTVSIKEQVTAFQEGRKPHPSDESAQDTWDRERKERAEAESKRQRELGESAMQREKQQKAINRGIIHRTSQGVPNEPEPPKEGIFGVRKTSDIDQSALQRAREESVTGE